MNPEALLKKYASDDIGYKAVLKHSTIVTKVALRIAKGIKGVDLDFIEKAAMLHDIGRFKAPPWANSVEHGVLGAEIMLKEGYPKIAKVCEGHLGGGIPAHVAKSLGLPERDMIPETVEEKIVCYADKLVQNDKEVSFEEALKRYEDDHPKEAVDRIKRLHEEIEKLMA